MASTSPPASTTSSEVGTTTIPTTSSSPSDTSPTTTPSSSSSPTSASSSTSPSVITTPSHSTSTTQSTTTAGSPTVTSTSGSASSTAQQSTTSFSSFTTLSTVDGSTFTVTSVIETVVPASTTGTPQTLSTTSSHTGAIVGGVVGGIGGLALIALLLFCIRKRSRKDEFDGDFDPDRVINQGGGTLPQIDLGIEDTPAITPFQYGGLPGGATPPPATMQQYSYGDTPYGTGYGAAAAAAIGRTTSPLSSPSHYSDNTFYPHSSTSEGAYYTQQPLSLQPGAVGMPVPHSPGSSISGSQGNSTRSAKEREAAARYGRQPGLGLATQHEGGEDVVVHRDGGRVEEEQPGPTEIPPTYESIGR